MTTVDSSWMDGDPEDEPGVVELTEKQYNRLSRRAMNVAMYQVNQGPKTEKQIRDRLVKKEIPGDIIEETVDELKELLLINDEEYAQEFTRSRHEYRYKASRVIGMELQQKGIDRELIEEVLETIDPESERQNAVTLVEKRLRQSKGVDRQKRTQRLVGMLARKGYGGSMAYAVVKEALDNEALEEEDES